MKKIILSISLILTFFVGVAQYPPITRSTGTNTVYDTRLGAVKNFFPPTYTDTVEANIPLNRGNDSVGALIFTTNEQTYWMRVADPSKRWVQIGGTIETQNSNSIFLSGDGSPPNPLIATLLPSGQPGNILQVLSDGVFVPNFIQNGRISGGEITWVANYTYDVTSVNYAINGVAYFAPETQVTLANSDSTFDRIDVVVANSNSTVSVITGTPSSNPQQPSHDPTTQVPLGFILVTAASTQPTINQEWIYINNAEWTTSASHATINPASAVNPYSVPLDVEGTLVANGQSIRFTDPSPPTTMSAFNILTLKLRSKGVFDPTSRIELRWYSGVTAVGTPVGIGDGTYGFISGQTSSYQTISIPLPQFGALTTVTSLLITVRTSNGNTIGFYVDDIQLQQAIVPVSGNAWVQGGNFMASLGVLGTLDNYPVDFISNNVVRMSLLTTGQTDFKAADGTTTIVSVSPTSGGQLRVGNSATQFVGLALNHLGGSSNNTAISFQSNGVTMGAIQNFSDNNVYFNFNTHVFRSTNTLTEYGRINSSGELLLNSVTDAGDFKMQVTGGIRLDATAKEITLVGLDTDNTATQVAGKDASGNLIWRDVSSFGGISAITADEGLTANTATNVRIGGTITANRTIATTSNSLIIDGTSAFGVLYAKSTTGTAIVAEATGAGGQAIMAMSATDGTYAISTFKNTPSTNTVLGVMVAQRTTTGTAGDGIGGSFDFFNELANGSSNVSNKLISKWTTSDFVTRKSQFIITGIHNAVEYDLFTLSSTGAARLNNYGIGTFTGTAAYTLQVDASGNIIEGALSGGVYTASNGLTMAANNTVFGGTLTGATTVNTGGFLTLFTGSNTTGVFNITNSGTGNAGVFQDVGSSATVDILKNNSNTNSDRPILSLERFTSGTAANGIAGTIDLYLESDAGSSTISNQILWKYTTAANATRTSQMIFSGVNSALTNELVTLSGNGAVRFNDYGINTFAGVAAYVLGVDASGNVVEVAAAGAGMANPFTTGGQIIYSVGTTPTPLNIGTAGQVLTVNAGATAVEWTTVGGTGTVTSVAQSFTGGLISVSGSPITTSGTLALTVAGTSGGVPYFSSASTWASSAALTANAIMIGGGAGAAPSTTTTGTGVLTALGVNVGSAGAFVTFNGALGTPSSGVATNLTGTATALNIGGNAATASVAPAGTLTGATLNATVVTSSLTTVGIIGAGTWQGTAIADTYISSAATWNAKQTGDATLTALAGLTITNGSILYGTGADAFAVLAAGSNGQVLTLAGGVPTWSAAGTGTVTSVTGTANRITVATGTTTPVIDISSSYIGQGTITTVGTITSGTWNGTTIAVARGGTGLTSATSGTIMIGNGTSWTAGTPTGSNGINTTMGAGTFNISNVFNPTPQTLVDGATITWNVTNGGNSKVTLAGTGRTLSITNPVAGYTYTIEITQGSGGSKTITTWPTGTTWSGSNTLSTAAGDTDVVVFYWNGTNFRAVLTPDYN